MFIGPQTIHILSCIVCPLERTRLLFFKKKERNQAGITIQTAMEAKGGTHRQTQAGLESRFSNSVYSQFFQSPSIKMHMFQISRIEWEHFNSHVRDLPDRHAVPGFRCLAEAAAIPPPLVATADSSGPLTGLPSESPRWRASPAASLTRLTLSCVLHREGNRSVLSSHSWCKLVHPDPISSVPVFIDEDICASSEEERKEPQITSDKP